MKREAPLSVRVPVAEQEAWKVQAEKSGLSLGGWVRMVCNAQTPPQPRVPATYSDGSRVVSVPDGEPMGMEIRKAPPVELPEVSGALPPTIDALVKAGKVQRGSSGVKKRSGVCVHRVPAGSWCKRCEEG